MSLNKDFKDDEIQQLRADLTHAQSVLQEAAEVMRYDVPYKCMDPNCDHCKRYQTVLAKLDALSVPPAPQKEQQ